MKVIRGQEASLESSKGFYKGSRSALKTVSIHAPESVKIYENQWESIKFNKNKWKSMQIYENPANL